MRNRRDEGREAGGKEGGERRGKGKMKGSKGKHTKKPIANDIISGRKLQTFILKIRKKIKDVPFSHCFLTLYYEY